MTLKHLNDWSGRVRLKTRPVRSEQVRTGAERTGQERTIATVLEKYVVGALLIQNIDVVFDAAPVVRGKYVRVTHVGAFLSGGTFVRGSICPENICPGM